MDTIYDKPYKGRIEHPRGTFWDRTEEGVRVTKRTIKGDLLYSHEYSDDDFADIVLAMTDKFAAPPPPVVAKHEPTPDPAPRATGGTPDADPVKPDAPKAPKDAVRTVLG